MELERKPVIPGNSHKTKRSVAAMLAACLYLVPQTLNVMASSTPQAGPVFSEKASVFLGIYESVSADKKIPGAASASPVTLDELPLTPAAAALRTTTKLGPDPKDACQVLGPFRMMARRDIRFEILRDPPNKLVILFENEAWGHVRTIGIDAEHIGDFTKVRPMWNGDSVAKWEDDTLVVDSIHFTNKTWLNEVGVTNSKQLHLTERFRIVNAGNYLEYRATAVDPNVLTEPVSYIRYFKRTTREIGEYECYAHKPASADANR